MIGLLLNSISDRKNGVPQNAVKTPRGISMLKVLLAIVSIISKNKAPSPQDAGITYL